ncbi:hypothetical protein ACHWQZ_G010136 [Mnemiopsis leidyi]
MQQYTRTNCFGFWVNIRLHSYGTKTTNIFKDLFRGYTLKHLAESFLGREMKKVQSCDELTDQQKKTRIEWIIAELQDHDVLPYNYVYDRDRLVIGDQEEISWFLWNLVRYDIRETWDTTRQYYANESKMLNESYSWIPVPRPESPDVGGNYSYKEIQTREKQRKLKDKKKKMKPEESIIEAIQIYIDNEGSGGKKSPPLNDIEDLSDTRILLRLINSIFPQTFTPEVLLNDRWTIRLALDLVGEMMGVEHSVDSEDLVHCDLMAICAFFVALIMKGLQFKQALAVVNRIDTLQDKLVLNTKALEELPNIAQSLDVIRQKKEYALKIEVIGKELSKMDGVHDVDMMRSWTKKLSVLQAQVNEDISNKIKDRFEVTDVPRSTTINSLVKFMYINLNLTTGVAFYTSNCKEVVSPERKLVLYDIKKNEFYDDFSGAENCNQSVRQLLNIPSREIVEVKSEQYEDKYIIYFESPSRNKLLKAGAKLLYQVFPGSPTQCERALFKAVKSGELDTVEKLIRFYKCDPSFVNATYRDTGNSSLHFAVKGAHFKIALFLLESGAGVNMQNKILQTPLFLAVEALDRQMASLLIEWGADIYIKNINNIDVIKLSRNDALKEFLLIKFEQIKTLQVAISNGDNEALSAAVTNHHHNQRPFASLRSRMFNGLTLIHIAAKFGAVPVIELLLEHRLEVDLKDSRGKTALHYVNDLQTAGMLLEARADVTCADNDGNTPLHTLCLGNSVQGDDQLDVGELFLENGASVLARNKKGLLPVHCCAIQGRADYIKLILGVGGSDLRAELENEERTVVSMLRLSTEAGHWKCSEWLLKNSFRFKEGEGEKILENLLSQKISHTNPQETVNFLIDLGTDPCHKNPKTGNQPLHYAARDPKFAEVLCLLLEMGADIEGENNEGETPLFSAVKSNNFHAAQLLIEGGANINHKNKMLLTSFQLVEDYDEWINSGTLSEPHKNLLRGLSLEQNQQTIKSIMRVVRSTEHSRPVTSTKPVTASQRQRTMVSIK